MKGKGVSILKSIFKRRFLFKGKENIIQIRKGKRRGEEFILRKQA